MLSVSDLAVLHISTVPSAKDIPCVQDIVDSSRETVTSELGVALKLPLATSDGPLGVGSDRELRVSELLIVGVTRVVKDKGILVVGVAIEVKAAEHWSVMEGVQNVLGVESWSF